MALHGPTRRTMLQVHSHARVVWESANRGGKCSDADGIVQEKPFALIDFRLGVPHHSSCCVHW